MVVFQFSTGRRKRKPQPNNKAIFAHRTSRKEKEEGPIGLIKGKKPSSLQEWRVAIALDALKLEYRYQVSLAGGRRVRGGQVIDFLVYGAVNPTPVFVQGRYWHTGSRALEDSLKQDQAKRIFHTEPVLLWEEDLETIPEAYKTVKEALL